MGPPSTSDLLNWPVYLRHDLPGRLATRNRTLIMYTSGTPCALEKDKNIEPTLNEFLAGAADLDIGSPTSKILTKS